MTEDGNWVAGSLPASENPTPPNWFFVRRSAVSPAICGYGANAKAPTNPQVADWGLVCKNKAEGG